MTACPKCDARCETDDSFCSQCGERLAAADTEDDAGATQKSMSLVDVHSNLGMVYFKKAEYDKALAAWERGLQLDPDNEFLKSCIADARQKLAP